MSRSHIDSFISLFYPEICLICGQGLVYGEEFLCLECLQGMPKTLMWKERDNKLEEIFWGRCRVERAASFLTFTRGGSAQVILHHLKYRGKKELGRYMGYLFASYLEETDFTDTIDCIIPIPLHRRRKRKRGYNQSEWIGRGMSECLGIPMRTDLLKRAVNNPTQTAKSRYERWLNVEKVFRLPRPEELEGKTILLADDVATTGATLEAAAGLLTTAEGCKVVIATLAYAALR